MPEAISVDSKDKITTIRVTERTKKLLESIAHGRETQEQIILKLIKLSFQLQNGSKTEVFSMDNLVGTKYDKISKTFNIKVDKKPYSVVAKYNDLTGFSVVKKSSHLKNLINKNELGYEVDLEIVNVGEGNIWNDPKSFKAKYPKFFRLFYFICLKEILEEAFDVNFYELRILEDYLDLGKWEKAYKEYHLSMDSYYNDVEKILR